MSSNTDSNPKPTRYRYTRAHRLSGARAYQRVFDNKLRKSAGPLAVLAAPVDDPGLAHHRLGLVVSRRVGNAVARHKIKRMLREAFRLNQHTWPGRYDLVIIVYKHEVLALTEYERLLARAVEQVHIVAERRRFKKAEHD